MVFCEVLGLVIVQVLGEVVVDVVVGLIMVASIHVLHVVVVMVLFVVRVLLPCVVVCTMMSIAVLVAVAMFVAGNMVTISIWFVGAVDTLTMSVVRDESIFFGLLVVVVVPSGVMARIPVVAFNSPLIMTVMRCAVLTMTNVIAALTVITLIAMVTVVLVLLDMVGLMMATLSIVCLFIMVAVCVVDGDTLHLNLGLVIVVIMVVVVGSADLLGMSVVVCTLGDDIKFLRPRHREVKWVVRLILVVICVVLVAMGVLTGHVVVRGVHVMVRSRFIGDMAGRSMLLHFGLVVFGNGLHVLLLMLSVGVERLVVHSDNRVVDLRVRVVRMGMVSRLNMVHICLVMDRGGMVRDVRMLRMMSLSSFVSRLVVSRHGFVFHNRH